MIAVNDIWCDACGLPEPEWAQVDGECGHLNMTIPFCPDQVWPDEAMHGDEYAHRMAPGDLCPTCVVKLREAMLALFAPGTERRIIEAPKVRAERERGQRARDEWYAERRTQIEHGT